MTLMGGADFQQPGRTRAGNFRYRFDDGKWRIEAGIDYSISIGAVRDSNASSTFPRHGLQLRRAHPRAVQ